MILEGANMQICRDEVVPFDSSWHLAWERSIEDREIREVAPCSEFRSCSQEAQLVGKMLWRDWLTLKGDEKRLYEPDEIGLEGNTIEDAAASVFKQLRRQIPIPITGVKKSYDGLRYEKIVASVSGLRGSMRELESAGLVLRIKPRVWLVRFGAPYAATLRRAR